MAMGLVAIRVQTREKDRVRAPRIFFQVEGETLFDRIDALRLSPKNEHYATMAVDAMLALGFIDDRSKFPGMRWRADLDPMMGPGFTVTADWPCDILVVTRRIERANEVYELRVG